MLGSFYYYKPQNLLALPDSSQLHVRTTYNPLYSEKLTSHPGGDIQKTLLRVHSLYAGWFSHFYRFNYYLSCSQDVVAAKYLEDDRNYIFTNQRNEWNIATGFAYHYGKLVLGFGLGRHWPNAMEREHLSEVRDHLKNYLVEGPWQLSVDAKIAFSRIAPRLSLFSGPIHSSLSKLATGNGQSFRMFPVSIIRHSADGGIDIRTGSYSSSSTFGIDYFSSADLLKVQNSMPQDVAIGNYRLEHMGTARLFFTDSLWWNVSGSLGGGWVAGYNFNRDRFTFFKSDALRLKQVTTALGVKLPSSVNAAVFQTASRITSPSGFLKLSALSSWSVFKPLDYHYEDATVTYFQTGGLVRRKFSPAWFDCTPQISLSYVKAQVTAIRSHKEIVVLLPIYADPVPVYVFRKLLLLEPSLSILVRTGAVHITGSIHQMIPFVIETEKRADPGGEPAENRREHLRITGGTMIALSAVWFIPGIGKE